MNGDVIKEQLLKQQAEQQLANYQTLLARALAKNAEIVPLKCPKCGGTRFVMHEVVEAIAIKVPHVLSGERRPATGEGEFDDISFSIVQRVFMCPNPKCDKKIAGVVDYGSELKAAMQRLAELKGETREQIIVQEGAEKTEGKEAQEGDDSGVAGGEPDKPNTEGGKKE